VNGVISIPLTGRPLAHQSAHLPASPRVVGPREFLAGPENRLVCFAVEAVLHRQSDRFNPLVLCGGVATGKSHLALGAALEWRRRRPHAAIVAISADEFSRDYLMALENDTLSTFRRRFRTADLFVLEDLDQLRVRPAGQDELALTLDALIGSGRQVIVTCRRPPADAPWLAPRLAARLTAGVEVPISPPGMCARRELVKCFAELRGVELTNLAVDRLAERLTGNARELLGALTWLEFNHGRAGHTIDADDVEAYLSQVDRSKPPTVAQVAIRTAKYFRLKTAELKGPSRRRGVVRARGVAMSLAREVGGAGLQEIGRYFGGRDRTTVLHSCRRTEQLAHQESDVQQAIVALREVLLGG
jgi:chromosomal replication initiator protein